MPYFSRNSPSINGTDIDFPLKVSDYTIFQKISYNSLQHSGTAIKRMPPSFDQLICHLKSPVQVLYIVTIFDTIFEKQ